MWGPFIRMFRKSRYILKINLASFPSTAKLPPWRSILILSAHIKYQITAFCLRIEDDFPSSQFDDFHVDYSHGGGCMDYITIFPPVDGQTEFCGSLIILSPGRKLKLMEISEMWEGFGNLKMILFRGKGQLYTFPREEPVTITFHTNEWVSAFKVIMNIILNVLMFTFHSHNVFGELYIYTRFGSARGFSAVYFRVDHGKLLYNALSLPVNHNVIV